MELQDGAPKTVAYLRNANHVRGSARFLNATLWRAATSTDTAIPVAQHVLSLRIVDVARRTVEPLQPRSSAATILKMAGVPDQAIQHLLGHSLVRTTQEIYPHLTTDGQESCKEDGGGFRRSSGQGSGQNLQKAPS
jgi:integrase